MPEYKQNQSNDNLKKEENLYRPSKGNPSLNKESSSSSPPTSEKQSSLKSERTIPGPIAIDKASEAKTIDTDSTDKAEKKSDSNRSKSTPDAKTPPSKIGEVSDEFTERLSGNIIQNRGSRPMAKNEDFTPGSISKNRSGMLTRDDQEIREKRNRSPRKKPFSKDLEGSESRPYKENLGTQSESSSKKRAYPKGKTSFKSKNHAQSTKKVGFFKRVLMFLGFHFDKGPQFSEKTQHNSFSERTRRKPRYPSGRPQSRRTYKGKPGGKNVEPRRNRRRPRNEGMAPRTIKK